ncbi:hypothetical protein BGY98DRAFT_1011142 [Russula aff. rugulosa BPL654]|nr:hypothetical protein BGY98DRAFT_1011142 [Russula aff. rugulosa BPL654]
MRLYHIVSGILFILPIIDFAVAMPVLVQEKRRPPVDELDELLSVLENHFPEPESSAARPSSGSPSSGTDHEWIDSRPGYERPNPESLESGYELMEADAIEPSSPAWSTMSDADPEFAQALPNPGPSTESGRLLTGTDAPMSSLVHSTWFHPDHGLMGAHAPEANVGPSNPRPSTESDSDHRLVAEEPPSGPGSPTEFDADHEYQVMHPLRLSPGSASPTESDDEMLYTAPSSPVSLTYPDRRDPSRGNAKELRRISGTARDVRNVA